MGARDHPVDIALSSILGFCDGGLLCAAQSVSRSWRRTSCCVNASQSLFQHACVQRWPWLESSLHWSHCGHHLWHRYLGSWQALCCDDNRANGACSLELTVPLDVSGARACVQGPWVEFPGRGLQLRINAYPVGNRRMTTTHLSAYLEVQCPPQKRAWHTALDFTFIMRHPADAGHEDVSWSSGPVRFLQGPGGGGRLDWGGHELLATDALARGARARRREVHITAHVALQEALVEVVHADWLPHHANDFGLCSFGETFRHWRPEHSGAPGTPVRLMLPASVTRRELLTLVSRAVGLPTSRLWRFSRSFELRGRLACNLPEAPSHLLVSAGDVDDDDGAVYALLTKWTLGESSGGTRQNFFRLLAEDVPLHARAQGQARVFVKRFSPAEGLRFQAQASVPEAEDVRSLLPPVLAAAGEAPPADPEAGPWLLMREGAPADWAEAPSASEQCGGLVNGHGPVVNGDVLVLCPRERAAELAALYRRQYERRVADFAALRAREAAQVGSTSFAELCRVMDALNVDVWRLEQLQSASARSLLALMDSLPGLHPQFYCDACGTKEFRGCRLNCLVCSDFDLCARCHAEQPETLRPEQMARPDDHRGRCHERSHRMVRVWPALPPHCLS